MYETVGRDGPASGRLSRAIKRIQERLCIPEWTAHDFRRTFAT